MPLELESDLLDDAAHAELDKKLRDFFDERPGKVIAAVLLSKIVRDSHGSLKHVYQCDTEARKLIESQDGLLEKLQDAWEAGSYRDIRNLKILRCDISRADPNTIAVDTPTRIVSANLSEEATVKSWSAPYRGNVAQVVYDYMKSCNNPYMYARNLAVVQSSGMGKSRMIDQLSKDHFVIPLNLRGSDSGYPAPDVEVRDWFKTNLRTPTKADNDSSAFLTALFEKTLELVQDPGRMRMSITARLSPDVEYPETLVGQFRLFMTIGQQFTRQGDLRVDFYKDVLERADELRDPQTPTKRKTPEGKFRCRNGTTIDLDAVVRRLLQKINPELSEPGRDTSPTLFLAFDEAHTITEKLITDGKQWSKFSSLRRALRGIRLLPVWSIFLSTTGKLEQFASAPLLDESGRIVEGLLSTPKPFSALGFDLLATKFRDDGTFTLERVASLEYRLTLGRPLWQARYEAGDPDIRETIIIFAIEKLLCRAYQPGENLANSIDAMFAVLSHRLALDFNASSCSASKRSTIEMNEMVQVERHMRVRLGIQDGLESLATVAASEPILVEAAATVMQHKDFSSCHALNQILQWPGMSKGSRGELIVANITIDTLDSLSFNDGKLKSLVVNTTSYFEALFTGNIYQDHIRDAMPSMLRDEGDQRTFAETFKKSRVYVTHFIKVYDYSVLSDDFFMRFAARGVGIVCADSQSGVDLILPITYEDSRLQRTNIAVIMKQSKADRQFSIRPRRHFFPLMNPFTLGIFNKQEPKPRPVIRMVYALAARKSVVRVMKRGERMPLPQDVQKGKSPNHRYTSFDIWCGQASSSTFRTIRPEDNATYQELLRQSNEVVEMFDGEQNSMKEVIMSMNPGATSKPAHWTSFSRLTTMNSESSIRELPSDVFDGADESNKSDDDESDGGGDSNCSVDFDESDGVDQGGTGIEIRYLGYSNKPLQMPANGLQTTSGVVQKVTNLPKNKNNNF